MLKVAGGALFSVHILVDLHFPEGLCCPKEEQKFTNTSLNGTFLPLQSLVVAEKRLLLHFQSNPAPCFKKLENTHTLP